MQSCSRTRKRDSLLDLSFERLRRIEYTLRTCARLKGLHSSPRRGKDISRQMHTDIRTRRIPFKRRQQIYCGSDVMAHSTANFHHWFHSSRQVELKR